MEKKGSAATRAKNKYNVKNYDRINLFMPKGNKELVARWVLDRRGRVSMNTYINGLIQHDMGMTDEQWKKGGTATPDDE